MSETRPTSLADRVAEANADRLTFLADGVFAIALTLAALEIRPPQHWDGQMASLWAELWAPLSAFAVSFVVIAAFWGNHKRVLAHLSRVDAPFTLINLVLLGLVALIPAATQMLYTWGGKVAALVIYAGLVAAIGLVQAGGWAYAAFIGKLCDPEVTRAHKIGWTVTMLVIPVFFNGVAFYGVLSHSRLGLAVAVGLIVAMSVARRALVKRLGG